jgi:hypothetical protein
MCDFPHVRFHSLHWTQLLTPSSAFAPYGLANPRDRFWDALPQNRAVLVCEMAHRYANQLKLNDLYHV